MSHTVPDKPSLEGIEEKWAERWENEGTYRFDRTATRQRVYAIDTPPPTVSGSLHVGHVFSFTHTDTIARYKRMRGFEVFYPMGWDDNGLPTERRVQNYFGVRCDPSLPYQEGFEPPAVGGLGKGRTGRGVAAELRRAVRAPGRRGRARLRGAVPPAQPVGRLDPELHDDRRWGPAGVPAGVPPPARPGEAYTAEAPTLWDVDFRTAVAQAELEDRERPGAYHQLVFHGPAGADLLVDTTRPELLAACVAVVAHPDDARYAGLAGTTVRTPLFEVQVPFLTHPLAQPDKGTGMAMVCTFGDVTDIVWWRELGLPVRSIVGRDGRLVRTAPEGSTSGPPGSTTPSWPAAPYARPRRAPSSCSGRRARSGVNPGRSALREVLREGRPAARDSDQPAVVLPDARPHDGAARAGAAAPMASDLHGHPVRQLGRGPQLGLADQPPALLRGAVSGVVPPGRARAAGLLRPLLAAEADLPVDPSTDLPAGIDEAQRGAPGGFAADPDVMDTWATSSLTPQIAGKWEDDPDLFARVWPMDLRPQSHEIIRTWLFATVVRAHLEFDSLPWSDVAISGWILDPDRKKMAKSKGNVVTPMGLLEQYGTDAVRYWAARARPGTDTAFDEGQMRIGRKLAIKILNVSRFVLEAGQRRAAGAGGKPPGRQAPTGRPSGRRAPLPRSPSPSTGP